MSQNEIGRASIKAITVDRNGRGARVFPDGAMLRPLDPNDRPAFDRLCARDRVRFLTLRLNIETRGLGSPELPAWGVFGADGAELRGVGLRHNNTLVAADGDGGCGPTFAALIDSESGLAGARGTRETMRTIRQSLQVYRPGHWDDSVCMLLDRPPACAVERMALARPATSADLDSLAQLYAGAGIMYRSRVNVAAKLEKRDRVVVIEAAQQGGRGSRIVSCALINVEGAEAGLIGGVYTLPEARGRGYAAACVSALCRDLQTDGKTPCLFYENPIAGRVYQRLGFVEVGQWSVLYLAPRRRTQG